MSRAATARLWVIPFAIFVLLALALFVNLDRTPPPWWDEGWTLLVAKTWTEQGIYARLLDGQLAPSGLSASPPTTALVVLAFRLLGTGLAQARVAIALVTWLSLIALLFLVQRLYDRRMAIATILVACLMSMHPQANPITMGRQVLAEPMMLLLLVAGALLLYLACERSYWFILPAIVCWGLAMLVKAQVLPFWGASLLIPAGAAMLKRRWRSAAIFATGALGGYLTYRLFLEWLNAALASQALSEDPVTNLYETLALVPVWGNRVLAFSNLLKFELPLLLAIVYFGWTTLRGWRHALGDDSAWYVRLSLYAFAASWLAWYLLLANAGIPRYLYPPTFVGSFFVAVLLHDLTESFDLAGTVRRAAHALRHLRPDPQGSRALGAILLVAVAVPFTLMVLGWYYTVNTNTDAQQMAELIDSRVAPNAVVESYDSELFFFMEHPYHYPPDQTHIDLIRRTIDPSVQIKYDALAHEPDYLVVGPFSKGWALYDDILRTGAFTLVETQGQYRLYERVH